MRKADSQKSLLFSLNLLEQPQLDKNFHSRYYINFQYLSRVFGFLIVIDRR